MSNIVLSLEVQNGFEYPRERELLTQELASMSARLEEEPDYTDEDELLVCAFEGEYHSMDDARLRTWWQETLTKLSSDFPDLLFALDIKSDDHPGQPVLRREYYLEGRRQTVEPQVLVPEFDPDGDFES